MELFISIAVLVISANIDTFVLMLPFGVSHVRISAKNIFLIAGITSAFTYMSVSYTHLDVYKRQAVHAESTAHVQRALQKINATGAKAMLALNPATPISVLDYVIDDIKAVLVMTVNPGFAGQKLIPQTLQKITDVRRYLDDKGRYDVEIEVDGNVSFENARKMSAAGGDIFVAGTSSFFNKNIDLDLGIQKLREAIELRLSLIHISRG